MRVPRCQLWATNPVEPTAWSLRTAVRFTSQAVRNLGPRKLCSALGSCCQNAEVPVGGNWQGWLSTGGICGGKKGKEHRNQGDVRESGGCPEDGAGGQATAPRCPTHEKKFKGYHSKLITRVCVCVSPKEMGRVSSKWRDP